MKQAAAHVQLPAGLALPAVLGNPEVLGATVSAILSIPDVLGATVPAVLGATVPAVLGVPDAHRSRRPDTLGVTAPPSSAFLMLTIQGLLAFWCHWCYGATVPSARHSGAAVCPQALLVTPPLRCFFSSLFLSCGDWI